MDPSHRVPVYIVREGRRARGDQALSDSQLSASSVMSTLLLVHNSFPSSVSVQALSTTPHIRFLLSKDFVCAQHILLLSSTLFLLPREGSRLFRTTLLRSRALSEAIQSNTIRCRVECASSTKEYEAHNNMLYSLGPTEG